MSGSDDHKLGMMRCTRIGCRGLLGASGAEVYRMICSVCGQNYLVRLTLEPIPPKDALQLPVGRAE